MSEFSERLGELMSERNLNRETFAEKSGVNKTCITHYLQGKSLPTVETLVKIADYFQRSTDFLLGREEENPRLNSKPARRFQSN
ncbi:MAG: helix-turn-helix domain-containing protein [Clostridia bacterium]|nr:helix-turn-helix domain-containing protein [Clostridia bacterium]